MNIKLSKPINVDGKEITEINLDLDSLTGRDLISAEAESRLIAGPSPVAELSKPYAAVVAAKAAKLHSDTILDLSARDFTIVTVFTQNFLLGEDLSTGQQKP